MTLEDKENKDKREEMMLDDVGSGDHEREREREFEGRGRGEERKKKRMSTVKEVVSMMIGG